MNHLAAAKQFSTHNPMLIEYVQKTKGPVLEMGSGVFSTPLLHWLCLDRELITYEDVPEFYHFAHKFQSDNHRVRLIKNWGEVKADRHFSVVLIDHKASRNFRRGDDALRFKDCADYIILHDTEPESQKNYGYDKIWQHFKYRRDWKLCRAWTTVVSNFKIL